MSLSSSSPPLTRLDVTTWTVHDESPAAVDAAADRRARWYFVFGEVSGWVFVLLLLLVVAAPSVTDVPASALLAVLVVMAALVPAAVVTVLRHRALRRHTGAPVVGDLHEVLAATAVLVAQRREVFGRLAAFTDVDPSDRAEAARLAKRGFGQLRRLSRHVLRHCELAALAERHGWTGTRDRQVAKIVEMCSTIASQDGRTEQ